MVAVMHKKFPDWPNYNKEEMAMVYNAYNSCGDGKGITKKDYRKIYRIMQRMARHGKKE